METHSQYSGRSGLSRSDELFFRIIAEDATLEKVILDLFNRQTSDEQWAETSRHYNRAGFSAWDAKRGTAYAKQLLAGEKLSSEDMSKARRMCVKYVKQLADRG